MGEVMTDAKGEAEMMFGTLQDFTDSETHSEGAGK